MKNLYLLFLLVTISPVFSQSVTWCPPGAEWHYTIPPNTEPAFLHVKYLSDTVIAGQPCKLLRQHQKSWDFSTGAAFETFSNRYTYEENGVIYNYFFDPMSSSGTWDTLYNFNAVPGQSWHYNPSGLNEKVEVQNTGQAMVNGHLLKWYTVKYAKDGAEHPVADTIYERLGSKEGIHPYRTHFIISDPGISGFCNYSDNDFSDWNQTDVACRSMPTSRNDLNNRPQFSVYPNPASEILTLVCEGPAGKAYSVTLHDLLGRQVLEDRITGHSQSFSVATVTNGVYWLSIINERGERFYQKVVVQR